MLQTLLTQHIGAAFTKQLALADYLDEHNWHADLRTGTIDFGQNRIFPIQLLGSESEESGTWLWAWANEPLLNDLPPALFVAGQTLRQLGIDRVIPELSEPHFSLDVVSGHSLALIASEICRADAYYRGPYDGGAAYFLLYETPLAPLQADVPRIMTVIQNVISIWTVDHWTMVIAYLSRLGFQISEEPNFLSATDPAGHTLEFDFDDIGRIVNMRGNEFP